MATNRYPILDGDGLCVNVVMLDPAEIEIITAEELSQRLADEAAARQAAIDEAAQETADALAAWEAECAALRTPYDQAWATHTAEREAWLAAFATWEAGDKGTPPPLSQRSPQSRLLSCQSDLSRARRCIQTRRRRAGHRPWAYARAGRRGWCRLDV